MTLEFFIYGIAVLMLGMLVLMIMCCLYIVGQVKCLEIKPNEFSKESNTKPVELDEKAQKEAEKRKLNKARIDEAQADMDKAVQDFISRGGLPK